MRILNLINIAVESVIRFKFEQIPLDPNLVTQSKQVREPIVVEKSFGISFLLVSLSLLGKENFLPSTIYSFVRIQSLKNNFAVWTLKCFQQKEVIRLLICPKLARKPKLFNFFHFR